MSKENKESEKTSDQKNDNKKGKSKLKSLLVLVRVVAFTGFSIFAYLLFQDLHSKGEERVKEEEQVKIVEEQTKTEKKEQKAQEVRDPDIFQESDLVDLGRDVRRPPQERFVDRFSKGDSDYIYQSLMKNKMQINDLKFQVRSLNEKIEKYKVRGKFHKIILAYVDLRQEIFFNGKSGIGNYKHPLKTMETLVALDRTELPDKIEELKYLLLDLHSQKELVAQFDGLITELMTIKRVGQGDDLGSRIRQNISKLVVVRKVGGQEHKSIDAVISKVEAFLKDENYQGALYELRDIDAEYKNILMTFVDNLNTALGVQKIDREILSYLKTLS